MKNTARILNIKKKIIPILQNFNVQKADLFGSYARGEQNTKSDIDIVIALNNKDASLFDVITLKLEMEKKLKKKVDLIEYDSIKSSIKKNILKDLVRIL